MQTGGQTQASGGFEQLHPRGRGGKWILKPGAGTGAQGPDQTTAQLQQRLKQLGFNVPQNGQYDAATAAAVASFQTRYGLDPHGGIDAATLEVLQNPPSQTLAQVQAQKKAIAKGKPTASAKGTSKKKTTKAKGKGTGGAQTGAGSATGRVTAASLGTGSLAQGLGMTGASNKNVTSLQNALTLAGYKTNADGRFGPQTEAAVKKLQTEHGLTADGVVGPETKGLLIGLDSTKATATKKITKAAAKAKRPSAQQRAAQPATLRTKQPKARHGSRTAGSRMQLKPPSHAAGKTLKYHAEHEEAPVPKIRRLEEVTLSFGTGGIPSMSIKDGRDTTPLCDQEVWTETGVIASPPDMTIQDGRAPAPPTPGPRQLVIPDARDLDQTAQLLGEAVAARKAATNGQEFTRALARERVIREQLLREGFFSEMLHPRGRGGKWVDKTGKEVKPGGGELRRVEHTDAEFRARGGEPPKRVRAPETPMSGAEVGRSYQGFTRRSGTGPAAGRGVYGEMTRRSGTGPGSPKIKPSSEPPIDDQHGGRLYQAVQGLKEGESIRGNNNARVRKEPGGYSTWVETAGPREDFHATARQATARLARHNARFPDLTAPTSEKKRGDMLHPSELKVGTQFERDGAGGGPYEVTADKGTHWGLKDLDSGESFDHPKSDMPAPYTARTYKGQRGLHYAGTRGAKDDVTKGLKESLEDQLQEAVEARKAAKTGAEFVRARAREQTLREKLEMEEAIGPIKKGLFHAWLGKKPDEPITDADIAKGKAAGGHPAKMAHFAEQARKWAKKKKAAKKAAKSVTEGAYEEALHPRGRGGEWIGKLSHGGHGPDAMAAARAAKKAKREAAMPEGLRWNKRKGALEGKYKGVVLERGVAYQGELAGGKVFTGHWTGEKDTDEEPVFKQIETGERRTFRMGKFYGKLSDVAAGK